MSAELVHWRAMELWRQDMDSTARCHARLLWRLTPSHLAGNWDLVGNNIPVFFIRDGEPPSLV